MSYLVYPGATHRRFEHSLGVMELAGRVFDIVTHKNNIHDKVRELVPEINEEHKLGYWRRALRMAAICHDMGHLPFSHAAEKELLPEGWDHERLTIEIIFSDEMKKIWEQITPPLRAEDIAKLAVGPKKYKEKTFSNWEAILSEIIIGDAFGVDRMDYLLRDSHHAGVAYGKFDHFRLIDTLRILPSSTGDEGGSTEPVLGVEEGGLHSAEALLLARYFMYTQVYFHPVRRIYDIHLKDFLAEWLTEGKFPTNIEVLKKITDNEVLSAILSASSDDSQNGHDPAHRIINREHYKLLYRKNPEDIRLNPESGRLVFETIKNIHGFEAVRRDQYTQKNSSLAFPVLCNNNRIVSSYDESEALQKLPIASFDYVFIRPDLFKETEDWLKKNLTDVIKIVPEED
jgi:HD superfamily phosphohydrolase